MAGDITRTIYLNAKIGSGFDQIGNTLMELGAEVDQVSQKLINIGKESLETYKDYEFNMAQARIALSTKYGQNTKELDEQMEKLGQHASEWAEHSIFHTNDVSNAIMLASRAGLDANEIIAAMPHLMSLAQAGGIDLSEGLDMAIKSMKALGYSMETDLSGFVDAWVYAANSSTGSVKEFGETFTHLGAVGRFTESKEELLALTALMHNFGTTGSAAATALRTAIMRIIAPSGIASKTLKMLGASEEDVKGIMEDKALLGVLNELEDLGFNAYTAEGELKPIMTIFQQLDQVMKGANWNAEKRINSLRLLFGMRGIVGASNIMEGMAGALELYDKLNSGNAEGYGLYAQAVMMDTLYGSTELYESKLEELQRKIGEELAPKLESMQTALGNIWDYFNGLSPDQLSVWVDSLSTIATLGPGLTIAGEGFKILANAFTVPGFTALSIAAFSAAVVALKDIEEMNFKNGFGLADLDEREIMGVVNGMTSDFTSAYSEIDKFKTSVNEAKQAYEEASATFSTNLLTSVITGNKMTADQMKDMEQLGMNMYMAVTKGLTDSKNASLAYWEMLYGGGEEALDDEAFQQIQKLLDAGYEDTLEQAASINQGIKDVLMKGFKDGFNQEDYAAIQSYMEQYNEMVARAAAEAKSKQDYIDQQILLHRAQTASLKDIQQTAQDIAEARDKAVQDEEQRYLTEQFALDWAYQNQRPVNGQVLTEEQYNTIKARNEELHNQRVTDFETQFDGMLWRLWETQVQESGLAGDYNTLMERAMAVMSGEMSMSDAISSVNGNNARVNDMSRLLAYRIANYGGYEGLEKRIQEYTKKGDFEHANALRLLYTMQQINDNYGRSEVADWPGLLSFLNGDIPRVQMSAPGDGVYPLDSINNFQTSVGLDRIEQINHALELFNWEKTRLEGAKTDLDTLIAQGASDDRVSAMRNIVQERTAYFNAAKQSLAGIVGDFSKEFGLEFLQDNEAIPLDIITKLNTSAVDSYKPPNKSAYVYYTPVTDSSGSGNKTAAGRAGETLSMFAEGGRATEASIFGEAGAEWAIPEEHSERTAELLNAARQASGFTWPDLLSRYGGLNANVKNVPTTVVYSPTINANDVTGVREALNEDKKRFEKWMREQRERDKVEMYA